jgi:hypothetical protein
MQADVRAPSTPEDAMQNCARFGGMPGGQDGACEITSAIVPTSQNRCGQASSEATLTMTRAPPASHNQPTSREMG